MSATTRATRSRLSSRRSSPNQSSQKEREMTNTPNSSHVETRPSATGGWVEPDLRLPAPSFIDDHLPRQGVLENMAPLGALPTVRLRTKPRPEGARFFHTPVLNGNDSAVEYETPTATLSPAGDLNTAFERPSEDRTPKSSPFQVREEDREYTPASEQRPSIPVNQMSSSQPPLGSTSVPVLRFPPPASEQGSAIVQGAIQQLIHSNPIVAAAIETVFAQNAHDPEVISLFEQYLNTAHPLPQIRKAFKHKIKKAISSGRSGHSPHNHYHHLSSHSRSASSVVAPPQDFSPLRRVASPPQRASAKVFRNTHLSSPKPTGLLFSSRPTFVIDPAPTLNGHNPPTPHPPSPSTPTLPTTPPSHLSATVNGSMARKTKSPGKSSGKRHGRASSKSPGKRSDRSSSLSSLNSTSSRLEGLAPAVENGNVSPTGSVVEVPAVQTRSASAKPPPAKRPTRQPPGPRVSSFTKRAGKRVNARAQLNEDPTEVDVLQIFLRGEFDKEKQQWSQYTQESDIRGEPVPASLKNNVYKFPWETTPTGQSSTDAITIPEISTPDEQPPISNLRNGNGRKRSLDELEADDDSLSSPPSDSDPPAPPPQALLPRPTKQLRKGVRIITSPLKREYRASLGMTAGVRVRSRSRSPTPSRSRGRGTRASAGNGEENVQQQNNDYCSSCGGNGTLLCCDGCPRSFHFSCCDPPIDPDHPPAGTWLCQICESKPQFSEEHDGLFSGVLVELEQNIPVSFALPDDVRNYYEGVKTGDQGEYALVNNGKLVERTRRPKVRPGFGLTDKDENEFIATHDAKGKLITCYMCGKSTDGVREIVPCDYCQMNWHLDCLKPFPAPIAPRRKAHSDSQDPRVNAMRDKERLGWMCPLHVDEGDFIHIHNTGIGQSWENPSYIRRFLTGEDLRLPKLRRPKATSIVDTALKRGFRNNGLIEIDNMPDDQEGPFNDLEQNGVVYRISERSIILDFIDRSKREFWDSETPLDQQTLNAIAARQAMQSLFEGARSAAEEEAALNLLQLRNQSPAQGDTVDQPLTKYQLPKADSAENLDILRRIRDAIDAKLRAAAGPGESSAS